MSAISILVANDNPDDADLIRKILGDEFERIAFATDPERAASDFEKHKPGILVLAFNTLEKAERYYLGLYRLSKFVHTHPHRTLILCSKDQLKQVYKLCRKDYFDDYILFWPATHDAFRLPMTIHHAVRDMARAESCSPTGALAAQARRVAELEELLQQRLDEGNAKAAGAVQSLKLAGQEINAAIDGFSNRILGGGLSEAIDVRDAALMRREIDRLKAEGIGHRLHALDNAVKPLGQWVGALKQDVAPHLESAKAMKAIADTIKPLLLIVDDDDFQSQLITDVLDNGRFDIAYASSGTEALGLLRKTRPDLILLDFNMPDMDGLETLRILKSSPLTATIPVIMVTGQSEKSLVVESLKAGATDFVVKPPDRYTLLDKVRRYLS